MYIFIQCWKKSSSVYTTVLRYYLCYHLPTYGVVFSFLPCCPATNISSHTVLGLLNQLQMKEFKQKRLYEGAERQIGRAHV